MPIAGKCKHGVWWRWWSTESSRRLAKKWLKIGGSAARNGGVDDNECSHDGSQHRLKSSVERRGVDLGSQSRRRRLANDRKRIKAVATTKIWWIKLLCQLPTWWCQHSWWVLVDCWQRGDHDGVVLMVGVLPAANQSGNCTRVDMELTRAGRNSHENGRVAMTWFALATCHDQNVWQFVGLVVST